MCHGVTTNHTANLVAASSYFLTAIGSCCLPIAIARTGGARFKKILRTNFIPHLKMRYNNFRHSRGKYFYKFPPPYLMFISAARIDELYPIFSLADSRHFLFVVARNPFSDRSRRQLLTRWVSTSRRDCSTLILHLELSLTMNISLFKRVAKHMLRMHYGLAIEDTHFAVDAVVQRELAFHIRPFEALNEYAEDFHLDRIDQPTLGRSSSLTLSDEIQAMADCQPVCIIDSDPMTCGECGSRTHFNLLRNNRQIHTCSNKTCLHEFIAEEEVAIA